MNSSIIILKTSQAKYKTIEQENVGEVIVIHERHYAITLLLEDYTVVRC